MAFATDDAGRLSAERRVQLLQALASALDSPALSHADLAGCRVLIGPELPTGIDRLGQLCLNSEEPPEDWQRMLAQVDMGFVADRQRHVQVRVLSGKGDRRCRLSLWDFSKALQPNHSRRLSLPLPRT